MADSSISFVPIATWANDEIEMIKLRVTKTNGNFFMFF